MFRLGLWLALGASLAVATAMATGVKVRSGIISVSRPGDGSDLYTVLEWARDRGRSTGLVTTVEMTDATPRRIRGACAEPVRLRGGHPRRRRTRK